jgi:hypothetical protein
MIFLDCAVNTDTQRVTGIGFAKSHYWDAKRNKTSKFIDWERQVKSSPDSIQTDGIVRHALF